MRDDHAADAPHGDGTPRRRFLKQGSALLAAGIAIGFRMPDAAAAGKHASGDPHPAAGEFEPNAWVRVLPDDDQARRAQARFGHRHAHRARGGGGRGSTSIRSGST